ncbi:uncharacterized protein FFB20_02850 [Fusarium fujikuroi]|uniref:Uncharacterized protein n=2 Tax=Fusarium fujikuroi TaxID=5127 RepID=S0DQL1_GIBF5|nr:uncharacterized protein FFUJ_05149 [Fusarium fujikuroi IMI 58289]SCN68019.1 uncharacterized protein FFB20_02850 [Fusarium fujikuroi]CCT63697.1 uncharacterized protein FFUJ_05149 [Fusarium fujikuroi IMI 58289]SCN90635.1 uncharacterized protein FFE2_07038 [Fusarium fujikuroi]SCN98494.1 uncharacterized protein FFM5_06852 [Fusarium fujikuroi]SCO43608.1 uncharacterized protein FFNC_09237 [Fusarium fujikuroi]
METFSRQQHKHHDINITTKDVSSRKAKPGPIRSWLWETLSLLLALGLLIATIVIPAQNNNRVLKPWPYDISLNTIIAILSTFMRASMLLVVAELIGQMGWNALQKPRPVSDLHHFNNASRGILGAMKLFWTVPPRLTSIIAALVIIISPAITPFAQQSVSTVPCPRTVQGQASLPISHYVPAYNSSFRTGAASNELSGDMKVAMMNGLVNPTGKDIDVAATCSTGNCTFPSNSQGITHSSIAMCSACIDTTEFIELKISKNNSDGDEGYAGKTYNYSLPNTQWLQAVIRSQVMAMSGDLEWALDTPNSRFAQLAKVAISNITTLSFTQKGCNVTASTNATCPEDRLTSKVPVSLRYQNAMATSCALYPCIKKYYGKVERGSLIEKVVDEQPIDYNRAANDETGNRVGVQTPCLIDGKEYKLANFSQTRDPSDSETIVPVDGTNYTVPHQCVYTLSFQYRQALRRFIEHTLFNTVCLANVDGGAKDQLNCGDQWWLPPLYNSTFEGLDASFDLFATAITNNFRKQGIKARRKRFLEENGKATGQTTDFLEDNDKATGQATEMAICTVFDWRWVLLPAGLMAITMLLLIVAVVQGFTNPGMPVWKTSILPLLFYGPNVVGHTQETDLDDLQKEAGRVIVRIEHDEIVRLGQVDTRGTES